MSMLVSSPGCGFPCHQSRLGQIRHRGQADIEERHIDVTALARPQSGEDGDRGMSAR